MMLVFVLAANRGGKVGRVFSQEWKANLSKAGKGRPKSAEHRRKIGLSNKGKKRTPEMNRENSERQKGKEVSDEFREKMSLINKGRVPWNKGKKSSRASKKKISEWNLKRWADPKVKASIIGRWRSSCSNSPNNLEVFFQEFLDSLYPGKWLFVGNGSLIVAGKNPDFMYVGSRKLLIELYGDYWHYGDNPQDRIDLFTPYGYNTLVIWESEIKKNIDLVERKIIKFIRRQK